MLTYPMKDQVGQEVPGILDGYYTKAPYGTASKLFEG
jgi:hypothetical protein